MNLAKCFGHTIFFMITPRREKKMPYTCRQIELGRSGFFPETKVKWEGRLIPRPYVYLRILSTVAAAELCVPEDLPDTFWRDIDACVTAAADAVGTTAIIASPDKALGVFEPAFKSCLMTKRGGQTEEVQVALSARKQPEKDWHR
jgi:hypothetical protein